MLLYIQNTTLKAYDNANLFGNPFLDSREALDERADFTKHGPGVQADGPGFAMAYDDNRYAESLCATQLESRDLGGQGWLSPYLGNSTMCYVSAT